MRLSHENILCHTASFCFAANPSASVHDISADIIRKKRGLLYLLPVPALQASRIAHFPKNEQRRKPTPICIRHVLSPKGRDST